MKTNSLQQLNRQLFVFKNGLYKYCYHFTFVFLTITHYMNLANIVQEKQMSLQPISIDDDA